MDFLLFFYFVFIFTLLSFVFLGPHPRHMEVPRLGGPIRPTAAGLNHSHWPTPQPQQCQILAVPVTYTTAHSNAGSLTH